MEVLKLLDDLESLIDKSRQIMGKATFVDVDKFFMLSNKLRAALPEEVKRATRIVQEEQSLLRDAGRSAEDMLRIAKAESSEIVARARDEAAKLTEENMITQSARQTAAEVMAKTESDIKEMRAEAEGYVRELLSELENHLSKVMATLHKGVAKLSDAPPPHVVAVRDRSALDL